MSSRWNNTKKEVQPSLFFGVTEVHRLEKGNGRLLLNEFNPSEFKFRQVWPRRVPVPSDNRWNGGAPHGNNVTGDLRCSHCNLWHLLGSALKVWPATEQHSDALGCRKWSVCLEGMEFLSTDIWKAWRQNKCSLVRPPPRTTQKKIAPSLDRKWRSEESTRCQVVET